MTTMESLIGLVNRIQRACTVLGDYGGGDNTFSSLWEALPSVAVVGGQVLFDWTESVFLKFWESLGFLESESEVSRERKSRNERKVIFFFFSSNWPDFLIFVFEIVWSERVSRERAVLNWISPDFLFCLNKSRVRENRRYWRALLGVTFFQEDQVKPFGFTSHSKDYFCLLILSLLIATTFCGVWIWIAAGIVTRRPLVLQLHKTEEGSQEYAEFLHLPRRKFTDFGMCIFSA